MPIKPVDFQIMIPRTVDASKSQTDDFSKLINIQKVANDSIKQESDRGVRQVQHRDKAYKSDVNKDGKRRNNYDQEDKEQHRKKEEKSGSDGNDSNGVAHFPGHIDIKI